MFDPPRGDACFSDDKHRLGLRRWWKDQPERWVAWLMLNPSEAGRKPSDPTMNRVNHFTKTWGFDGCIVVNLYPFVAPRKADMWSWRDALRDRDGINWWHYSAEMECNLIQIEEAGRSSSLRIVAFGVNPVKDPIWVKMCLDKFEQHSDGTQKRFRCLDTTKEGWPTHPHARGKYRVDDDAKDKPWIPPTILL